MTQKKNMIIRCTQKLLTELKQKPSEEEITTLPLWSWHANVFNIERRKCVLITNDKTLFTVFIPALKKPNFQTFHSIFGQVLFKYLLFEEFAQNDIEKVLSRCEEIKYGKTNNRSVLGSMNDQKLQLEHIIQAEGGLARTDILVLNHRLNRNRLSAVGYKYAIEILTEKLKAI